MPVDCYTFIYSPLVILFIVPLYTMLKIPTSYINDAIDNSHTKTPAWMNEGCDRTPSIIVRVIDFYCTQGAVVFCVIT